MLWFKANLTQINTPEEEREENVKKYLENIKEFLGTVFGFSLAASVVFAISCILLIVGIFSSKNVGLMLPYLIFQLFLIILFLTNIIVLDLTLLILFGTSFLVMFICSLFTILTLAFYIPYLFIWNPTIFWISRALLPYC